MNLFTHFLKQWTNNRDLDALVDSWDKLERLVIRVYKAKQSRPEDDIEYQQVRKWLQNHYPSWQPELTAYWQKATVAGRPAGQDPFLRIISHESAALFIGDWEAMQHLPAAREALNRLVLALGKSDER